MPIYEFCCLSCGEVFEVLQRFGERLPSCPLCRSPKVEKLISAPGVFIDRGASLKQRESSILKRAGEYLRDGKVGEARRFLAKAQEYVKTDGIKRLSEHLTERRPQRGYLVSKPAAVITKKKP
ncbi:FmdB family zinc ribbon protein [Thermosulfuriphilus sp.]